MFSPFAYSEFRMTDTPSSILVWTTISNAVLTARVGYSVREIKVASLEQRTDVECGARGSKHITERSV